MTRRPRIAVIDPSFQNRNDHVNRRDTDLDMAVSPETSSPEAPSTDDPVRLTRSLEHESNSLWKHHRLTAIATLTLPIWLSAAILVTAAVWGGFSLVRKLILATVASAVAGRLVILGGESADQPIGFSAIQLALLVLYLDTIWAIVLTWHAGALFHVPWMGPRLKAAVEEGSLLIRRNRWMRNVTVAAVMCFVMLPISSTGSIGGSLLGRLLGLSRRFTLTIVLIGSVLGCAVMYAGAAVLRQYVDGSNPAVRYGGIAILVLLFFVLSRRYRRAMAEDCD